MDVHKRIPAALAGASVLLALAGCGSDPSPVSGGAVGVPVEVVDEAPPAANPSFWPAAAGEPTEVDPDVARLFDGVGEPAPRPVDDTDPAASTDEPAAAAEPTIEPDPVPEPEPEPDTDPLPLPLPLPEDEPTAAAVPEPRSDPTPDPESKPKPESAPDPVATPAPAVSNPDPDPAPKPEPKPDPEPEEPKTRPTSDETHEVPAAASAAPDPIEPAPEPRERSQPADALGSDPDPEPAMAPEPAPEPISTPPAAAEERPTPAPDRARRGAEHRSNATDPPSLLDGRWALWGGCAAALVVLLGGAGFVRHRQRDLRTRFARALGTPWSGSMPSKLARRFLEANELLVERRAGISTVLHGDEIPEDKRDKLARFLAGLDERHEVALVAVRNAARAEGARSDKRRVALERARTDVLRLLDALISGLTKVHRGG